MTMFFVMEDNKCFYLKTCICKFFLNGLHCAKQYMYQPFGNTMNLQQFFFYWQTRILHCECLSEQMLFIFNQSHMTLCPLHIGQKTNTEQPFTLSH